LSDDSSPEYSSSDQNSPDFQVLEFPSLEHQPIIEESSLDSLDCPDSSPLSGLQILECSSPICTDYSPCLVIPQLLDQKTDHLQNQIYKFQFDIL